MKTTLQLIACSLLGFSCQGQHKPKEVSTVMVDPKSDALRQQLDALLKTFKATVGVGIMSIEDRDTITIGNQHDYPTQSVFKFPLAMAVLDQVDKGKLTLDKKIRVKKADLRTGTWSPLREKHPEGDFDITVKELLEYTVSMSDNNTCDILFKLIGGTAVAEKYVQQLGVKNMAIKKTETEMATAWDVQYLNYSSPYAMIHLLDLFYTGKALSPASTRALLEMMTQSSNSAKRIKGALPPEAVVAHKTGSSGDNKKGMTAATNDVGIVTLPDGKHFAIAVFVSDSYESSENNEKIIALIAAQVYSYLGMRSVGTR